MKVNIGIIIAILTLISTTTFGQVYIEKQTRHRFAQLHLGADFQTTFGGRTSFLNQAGQLQTQSLGNLGRPRLIIGGTHFWGHADFYVAFPIAYPSFETDEQRISFGSTVETVFKYYPWRITDKKIRPFVGTGLVPHQFLQNSKIVPELEDGDNDNFVGLPLYTGFTYNRKGHLFELSLTYHYKNKFDYYIAPNQTANIETPPLYLSLGYRYMFDTTISAEKNWESGRSQQIAEELGKAGKLSNFFVGIAPSSAFGTRRSPYNEANHPYFDANSSGIFLDIAAGYHFYNANMNLAVSWRKFGGGQSSFGVFQDSRRNSLAIELTKNIADYHGFVPFIGPCVSWERLSFQESVNGNTTIDAMQTKPAVGVTFGWDILPNRLQKMVLRTNLRYFPNLNLDLEGGEQVAFDSIEFNFIQLIIYPERIFQNLASELQMTDELGVVRRRG